MFRINQHVITPAGKGIVKDTKIFPIDGRCYLIHLENGQKVWRKESVISISKEDAIKNLAKALSIRFNLDPIEVETIIKEII